MKLRKLEIKDAVGMLEWMHDEETQQNFRKNMLNVTLEEATDFCREAKEQFVLQSGKSIHMAIADNVNDEYLGTISLKKIDLENKLDLNEENIIKISVKDNTGIENIKESEECIWREYVHILEDR